MVLVCCQEASTLPLVLLQMARDHLVRCKSFSTPRRIVEGGRGSGPSAMIRELMKWSLGISMEFTGKSDTLKLQYDSISLQ